ncbi:class I SAM-dependent methyltransferase [Dyella sp.]|uniref:class I SAM-dependent methyltransferase n=1 Tax=Dyella sp. TaxID=1869338 RepID=UPI0032162BB8
MSDRGSRWDEVYRSKGADTVSWYQARPVMSLALIEHAGVVKGAPVIDVGGGASSLVDHLLHEGYVDLAVMDLSDSALATSRERLGERASQVDWIAGDVLAFAPLKRYALWHDRAVFHFLVKADDRRRYLEALHRASQVGTQVVMATFAEDGPERCSGLPVARYRAAELHAAFGADYELVESTRETHRTPGGAEQHFTWVRMRRVR